MGGGAKAPTFYTRVLVPVTTRARDIERDWKRVLEREREREGSAFLRSALNF